MNQRQWLDHCFKKDLDAFRAKHGLTGLVSTGPATAEEMEAARGYLGEPQTHEEWLAACKAQRAKEGVDSKGRSLEGSDG
jgi:hypothetical protein